jgi:hypothetical protein
MQLNLTRVLNSAAHTGRASAHSFHAKATLLSLICACSGFAQQASPSTCQAPGIVTASPGASANRRATATLDTSGGRLTFTLPEGEIRMDLPQQMIAGDAIQFNLSTEPAGTDAIERARNGYILERHRIDVAGYPIATSLSAGKAVVPSGATSLQVSLLDAGGQTLLSVHMALTLMKANNPPEEVNAGATGAFKGTTSHTSALNCKGKLGVNILTDKNGKQLLSNVTVSSLTVSETAGVIDVKLAGSLTNKTKDGTFWIEVVKECEFNVERYQVAIIVHH